MTSKPSISEIFRETGIARSTLARWRDEGIDIGDRDALQARAKLKQHRVDATAPATPCDAAQANVGVTGESYAEARRRREIAVADRAETLAARERGELVAAADIVGQGQAIGFAVRAGLDQLASQLPPRLAGRDAAEVDEIIRAEFRRLLLDLSDRDSLFLTQ